MPNNSSADWDESAPIITNARRLGAQEIRFLRAAVGARLLKEHIQFDDSTVGGEHKEGSAKIYYQASAPTLRPDGSTSLDSTDEGRLWLDSDTLYLYHWNGSAWIQIGGGPSPQIAQFEVNYGDTTPSVPITQSGLTNGTYIVFVCGASDYTSNVDPITISVTVNTITRTITLDNQPDGNVSFCIPLHVTVSAGTCSLTAVSGVDRITSLSGFLTVAS